MKKEISDREIYRFGPFQLDVTGMALSRRSDSSSSYEPVRIPPIAFLLLVQLIRQPGKAVSKEDLWENILASGHHPDETTFDPNKIDQALKHLRNALGGMEESRSYISAPRRHLNFIGDVSRVIADIPDEVALTEPNVATPIVRSAVGNSIRIWVGLIAGVTAIVILAFSMATHTSNVTLHGPGLPLSASIAPKLTPLITDQRFLYFQESDKGRYRIMRSILNDRAEPIPLVTPLENADPGVVSPDGSALLLRDIHGSKDDDQPLYIQPVDGSQPLRLGNILAYDSAWTPDQRHIIFSHLKSVYEATATGRDPRKLFDVPGRAYWFRWSPNGDALRFTVYDSKLNTYRIWQTKSLDLPPEPISFGIDQYSRQCCGTWSGDGSYFVFQAAVNQFFQLFISHERVGLWAWFKRDAVLLTTPAPINFRSPVPISNGHRLIALSEVQKSEIVQYDRGAQQWKPLLDGIAAATVAFSHDGKWLVFTRMPDHVLFRCRMPSCTDPVQLTFPPLRVTMPQWSPDDRQISCMVKEPDRRWQATLVSPEGGGLKPLVTDPKAEADPTWSPDGHQIAFGAAPGPETGSEAEIKIVNLQTKEIQTVIGSRGFVTPHWSPDGRFLAAVEASTLELAFYEFTTGTWRRQPGMRVGYLNWSIDGSRLYFLSLGDDHHGAVMVFDLRTLKSSQVASLANLRQPLFSFGDWIGIGPSDTSLALRDLSTDSIISWSLDTQ